MLSPDYLLRVSEGGEAIAETLHNEIIKKIVDRISARLDRGDDYILTAYDKWQIEVLHDAGYLREDIVKELARYTGLMQNEIAAAMVDAGVKSLESDADVYRAAGLSPAPLEQSPYLTRLMQRNYEATMGEWINFTGTTADACQQSFIKACDTAYTMVSSGAMGYSEAFRDAINTIIESGATVTYPSGHTDTIETATLRCIRTGVSQATAQITDARMDEMDWDIILVSSHLGARVTDKEDFTNHYWWQGKFYSKSGKDKRFPPFSACGEGTVQGIHGANCRHSHGPGDGEFNPYEHYDSEENRKEYELQQRQRLMERRIRESKRECIGLKQGVDSAKTDASKALLQKDYEKAAAKLQKRNEAYNQFCEDNNLKKLNERITIAKWDRSQAAKARAAAKKYAVDHPDAVVPKEYKPSQKKVEQKKPTMQERMINIDFKPAETIQEAEAYADRFVEKYKSKYSGNVSFKGMDVDQANKVNRVLSTVYDAYDIPPHTDITVMNYRESKWKTAVDDGVAAAYQWGGNGGRLFINQKLIGTQKAAAAFKKKGTDLLTTVLDGADKLLNKPGIRPTQKQYIEALVNSGRQVVAQSCEDFVESTIVHEMGHSLDNKVFRKYFKTSTNMDGLDIGASMEKYAGKLSGYAVSQKEEYIAESFAAWWYGMTDVIDPELAKIFEGSMKK